MPKSNFHSWSIKEVEEHFEVDRFSGLTEKRAKANLAKFGPNSFENLAERTSWQILIRQFTNFFILLLVAAAAISYFVDGLLQAVILLVIVAVNVLLGYFQENKAERALLELKKSYRSKSKILRERSVRIVSNEELTLGDIVILEAGDKVPADLRVVEEESLRADESVLTGESVPLSKNAQALAEETSLADRRNMLYASTHIVVGRGRGVVVAIGQNTEFGKIADLVQQDEEETPLERKIAFLGKRITIISVLVAILVFSLGYFRQMEVLPLLTFTIALLVAAVPESLPTAITLSLAVGVARMTKQKAIVRRMAAVETLGTVDIIATDKTGTLTDNQLTVDTISLLERGGWQRTIFGQTKRLEGSVGNFFARGIACSNVTAEDAVENIGDPVEIAIVQRAISSAKASLTEAKKYHRVLEIPFDSDKKYMAVLTRLGGRNELIVKGMPERVVSFCNLSRLGRDRALQEAADLSQRGFKVIALASKVGASSGKVLSNMKLLGLFALVDEPAAGIKEAVRQAIRAKIRPIIITGDHPETARFVANQIGLAVADDEVISETQLKRMSQRELKLAVGRAKIFARITPGDKIRIVKALEELGYIVAVTGDGVNDAPALKEAHVGIAMGIKGTDVARSASDIILSDDHYRTIISAIEYGRTVYDNIKNVIIFLLTGNLNEILLVTVAIFFGLPAPVTTLQILWVNLITDSFPALALSIEKPSRRVLLERPRSASSQSTSAAIWHAVYLSIVAFILCLGIYLFGLHFSPEKARTMTFTFFVFIELTFAFSLRSKKRIWQSLGSFFENKYLLGAILLSTLLQAAIFFGPLRPIFDLVDLEVIEIGLLVLAAGIAFISAEIIRFLCDRKIIKEARQRDALDAAF